jgi:hypothetical protein
MMAMEAGLPKAFGKITVPCAPDAGHGTTGFNFALLGFGLAFFS